MLFRLTATLAFAASLVSASVGPNLRINKEDVLEANKVEQADIEEGGDDDKWPTKGGFSVAKAGKCTRGFSMEKGGAKKHCGGGMKKTFAGEFSDEEMMSDMATELLGQIQDFMPGHDSFLPDEETMTALKDLTDSDEDDVDFGKSIKFGGSTKIEWGCKMSFKKSKGKISKSVECGAKLDAVAGSKKRTDFDDSVFNYIIDVE